ncbi:isocitrate lyase/PEP mutase family protein [Microbacterium sp. No. 7]|uniref:isocitrate lyase/PEP mutase family protein n=1 Tax=Microbacterium sp. No. 7 TaxID=1714373 RepID=UPI0006D2A836|nr:isocitrate lyase/PEP mutase family protein [Microbacterium sp. No. 7]
MRTRDWISTQQPRRAIGAFDALSARTVEAAGADCVYLGSYALTASSLAAPDVGLLSFGEVLAIAARASSAVTVPVIVDIDAGYGGPANVARAVREFARAGVAAVQIEDQVNPKRCGHFAGKEVVPRSDAVARIAAAVDAAGDDIAVIARTDSLATHGLDEAIWRVHAFEAVGASATFVDAVTDLSQVRRHRDAVRGPIVFNAADTGVSPAISLRDARELGVGLVLYPVQVLFAVWRAAEGEARRLLTDADDAVEVGNRGRDFSALNTALGLPALQSWEMRLTADAEDVA